MSIVEELKRLSKDIQRSVYRNIFSILDESCNNAWYYYAHTEGYIKDRWKKEFEGACSTYRRILEKVEFLK